MRRLARGHARGGFPVFAEDIRLVKFLIKKKLEPVRRQPARYAARVRTDATHQFSDASAAVQRFEMDTDTLKEILEQMPDADDVLVRSTTSLCGREPYWCTAIITLIQQYVLFTVALYITISGLL